MQIRRKIIELFPHCSQNGQIDRKIIAQQLINDQTKLQQLEKLIHPIVRKQIKQAIKMAHRQRKKHFFIDIALLYEGGLYKICHKVILAVAKLPVRRIRYLKRGGLSVAQFNNIVNKQLTDKYKIKQADFIIQTGLGKDKTIKQLNIIYKKL